MIRNSNPDFIPMLFAGDQGDVWHRYETEVLTSDQPFQLVIEGVVGTSYRGDIAIDDISLTPGCIVDSTTTLSPTGFTVPTSLTCKVGEMA